MFLQQISNELISKHGNNLAKIAVVFPNKRASLWMNDSLLSAAEGKPVFAPQYFSISEFFQKHSEYILADHIQLVSLLHKSYCKITGEAQTLDSFYAWGEILLSDFDNADKSLADPKQLFQNISSLHEMDSIDYLTDEQKQLLEHFFKSFTRNHESIIQQKFISLWNNLLAIYNDFKATLHELGIAYEGMLYRDVVEKAKYDDFDYIHYYAIGFNQLLKCEQKLFLILADKITQKHDDASILTVNKEANITIAQALTDDLQTRYIEQWLQENDRISAGRRTAIILCNENLLPSAIYGLPENVGAVNITAGFPLAETQPASYISTLLELCTEGLTKDGKRFRTSYLRNLEGHPLHKFATKDIDASAVRNSTCKILEQMEAAIISIACNIQSSEVNNQLALLQEATFRVYNIITRLKSLYEEGSLEIEPLTLANLYKQIIQTTTIPFHGEPAVGIQIMGVLETRNLDFDHILMLSCNEGQMPQGGSDASAIPYNIKKAFELSTNDDRTNIFAYYFYRLLKRCKDVTLVYNASGSETSPGEMSRFLLNLIVNNAAQISRIAL
ncbi:MAG: PD-(D/E)XK nuclease family protein, partial [Prevotella sp.]|nr:PD-(D/E)XK nuclease family protein [Prevotella sp.]